MKIARLLIVVAAAVVFSGVALADTVDPAIGVKGGGGSVLWTGSVTVLFEPGQDGVTCGTNGLCSYDTTNSSVEAYFINEGTITDFAYSFDQSQTTAFSLAADNVFPILTIINDVNTADPLAFLSGGTIGPACVEDCPAVTIAGDFALEASNVVEGTLATFTSNVPIPTPEPGTIVLLSTGIGYLGLMRRRRSKKVANSAA
jgi:hypothetical protein